MVETRLSFGPAQRLRSSRQFQEIYKKGIRVHCSSFVLYGSLNQQGYHRLGITVSRKVGGAVVRNRVKRQIREVFRTKIMPSEPGIDMIVNAKRPIVEAPFLQIQREFLNGLDRLKMLLEKPVASEPGSPK